MIVSARTESWHDKSLDTYLGVRADGGENGLVVRILQVKESSLETLVDAGDTRHVAEGTAVDIVDTDDVRVGSEGLQDCRGGCRARCKGNTVGTASLERGEGCLESIPVRVTGAGILEALRG